MLRITQTAEIPARTTLSVDGRITGEWVQLLRWECDARLAKGCDVVLDLARVSSIDYAGALMLRALAGENVQIVNVSPLVSALLTAGES